jgi:hypothetical protein
MSNRELETASKLDLAKVNLNFEGFRLLCRNPNLSVHEKIGFPDSYRQGAEPNIFEDIRTKLPALDEREKTIVDIGPGCANLPRFLIDLCASRGHKLVLVDSEEMLAQLPDAPFIVKVSGAFPKNIETVRQDCNGLVDALLCYSVLHYMFVDTNLFDVIDEVVSLLGPGGAALIGDIPNISKRKRFFASETGMAFHRRFMQTEDSPSVKFNVPEPGNIDDAVLAGLVYRCQLAGCDGYIVPQRSDLPMANRRDDLLIRRP